MNHSKLIVNADDFGLHSSVNQAIVEGHRRGIITSTSLLASGDAFDEAVALAKEVPTLGIGIHTALVGGLHPVCAPEEVPSLLVNGRFPETYTTFMKRVAEGLVNFNEVHRELEAQCKRIVDTGLTITHIDGHQHLHVLPQVAPMIAELAAKYGVSRVRVPSEQRLFMNGIKDWGRYAGKLALTEMAERARCTFNRFGLRSTVYFWGMMAGGQLNEERLVTIIDKVTSLPGTHEIMTHPGMDADILGHRFNWGYHWDDELAAMCSARCRARLNTCGVELITYGELE